MRLGQAWSSASPRGQWRTGENGENWLQNHLWCPNDPRGQGIHDDDDDTEYSENKNGNDKVPRFPQDTLTTVKLESA